MPNSEAILFVNCELNSFILIIWLMVLVLNEKMDYNKVSSMTDELYVLSSLDIENIKSLSKSTWNISVSSLDRN